MLLHFAKRNILHHLKENVKMVTIRNYMLEKKSSKDAISVKRRNLFAWLIGLRILHVVYLLFVN